MWSLKKINVLFVGALHSYGKEKMAYVHRDTRAAFTEHFFCCVRCFSLTILKWMNNNLLEGFNITKIAHDYWDSKSKAVKQPTIKVTPIT